MAIELAMHSTLKINSSAHLPHKRFPLTPFTATLEDLNKILVNVRTHEVLMDIEANTQLAGHADGFGVGYAIPKQRYVSAQRREREHLHCEEWRA